MTAALMRLIFVALYVRNVLAVLQTCSLLAAPQQRIPLAVLPMCSPFAVLQPHSLLTAPFTRSPGAARRLHSPMTVCSILRLCSTVLLTALCLRSLLAALRLHILMEAQPAPWSPVTLRQTRSLLAALHMSLLLEVRTRPPPVTLPLRRPMSLRTLPSAAMSLCQILSAELPLRQLVSVALLLCQPASETAYHSTHRLLPAAQHSARHLQPFL